MELYSPQSHEQMIAEYTPVVQQEQEFLSTWAGRKVAKNFGEIKFWADEITSILNTCPINKVYNPGKDLWDYIPHIEAAYHPQTKSLIFRKQRVEVIVFLHEISHHIVHALHPRGYKRDNPHGKEFLATEKEVFELFRKIG